MTHDNASLAERWRRSATAQGVALGMVLGPVGMLFAWAFSSPDKRESRFYGALRGSLGAAIAMLVIGIPFLFATGVL